MTGGMEISWRAMGSTIRILLDARGREAEQVLLRVPEWFERWEAALSRFRPDSELNRLNRSAGGWEPVSQTLWSVIRLALRAARETDGMLTPLILPALETAGYAASFDPSQMAAPAVDLQPLCVPDWRAVQMRPQDRSVRLPDGSRMDLGGFGKGWAARRTARRLARLGRVIVDAGGDIALAAPDGARKAVSVKVADPWRPGTFAATVRLAGGGVATSGRDYRRWRQDGTYRHHLIDPRSGLSADTDVITATVAADDVVAAEQGAKMALLLGARDGLRWLEAHPELEGLLLCDGGRALLSRGLKRHGWRMA